MPSSYNQPFNTDFEPALHADALVETQPDGTVHVVELVEVFPKIQTETFTVPESGLEEQQMRSLYAPTDVLAQYRLFNIPDNIEIRVNQGGQESPRFNNKNERGFIDSDVVDFGDAAQQTEIFQWEDTDLFFDFANTGSSGDIDVTLGFSGWGYSTTEVDVDPQEADIQVLTERASLKNR